jgi:outer membrane protein
MIILRIQNTISVFILMISACNTQLHAADLLTTLQLAETNDPVYREAIASYRATLESKPQARSQLLPLISLNAHTVSHNQDISTQGFSVSAGEVDFNSHGYSLDITQPLFRADRFFALQQTDSIIQRAEADLTAAQQELILRVAERYFLVLGSNDNLDFTVAEKKSLQRQLEQAKQQFEVGLTAITDVQEAQAGYDRAVANEILAVNTVDNTRERLREITGEYLTDFAPLGEDMPLIAPEPADIDAWTEIAHEQNLGITSAQQNLETARQEIKIQNAGHFPTLDLVASKRYDTSGGRFGATQIHDDAIGLELNVPLYEGGLVNSETREARQRYEQALEQLEQQYRGAQRQTREAYLGVISGISQVKALNQALISTETALQATTAGFELGTRTAVDVVAAERATLQAKRDYARARYDYLLNILKLKLAAGTLSPDDLRQINSWLE